VSAVSPARACAFDVLRRVFEHGAYADRALASAAAGLAPRDRALAMQLAFGTVQRKATLDHVVGALSGRGADALDPPVLAALRLGLFQLMYLDAIAEYAAVGESVELAKRGRGGGFKLVNAVLRRAAREGRGLVQRLPDDTPAQAAIAHSVPDWLAELWWDELGAGQARALLERINQPAESALRVNTLVAEPLEVLARLPAAARAVPAPGIPEGLVLSGPFDAAGSQLWRDGMIFPQSRASMTVARVLAPEPGASVLDLCAAPGGKTTHLAALLGGQGQVVAVEQHSGRAEALRRTCARLHASNVRVETADASVTRGGESYGFVLADPPCSGLGTLQSRPDLRWRASPGQVAELAELQGRILESAAIATAPGGALVYSVCTITQAETEAVVDRFLARHPEFRAQRRMQLLPHVDGTDGFFISRLAREQ
jgi:16S rRNA (cytosine967-C5)-methyltransferase